MAVLAAHPICAIVPVVLAVTTDAAGGYLPATRRLVAFGTADVPVLALQPEACLVVVVIPVLPVARVMAGLASLPENLLVHILLLVARPAVQLGIPVPQGRMAFLAFGQQMLAGQRIARHQMVEIGFLP